MPCTVLSGRYYSKGRNRSSPYPDRFYSLVRETKVASCPSSFTKNIWAFGEASTLSSSFSTCLVSLPLLQVSLLLLTQGKASLIFCSMSSRIHPLFSSSMTLLLMVLNIFLFEINDIYLKLFKLCVTNPKLYFDFFGERKAEYIC